MRKYETVFILNPDVKEQARSDLFDRVKNIIDRENGILLDFDEWGNKKLAYEIKKKLRGFYVCITYGGTGPLVKEIERNLRLLNDNVLKFMTLLLSDDVTVKQLEDEAREYQDTLSKKNESESAAEDKVGDDAQDTEKQVETTQEKSE